MLDRGDKYYMAICNTTGTIAIYNENKNLYLSPMADGPIKFVKKVDETLNIVNVSRFGRKFSIVKVPYAFKLLMHELQTMNIQMRIITEDNINNLVPLTASKDIEKLTGKKTLREVQQENIRNLKESEKNIVRTAPRRKELPPKTPFFQPGVDEALPTASVTTNPFAPPGASMPPPPPLSEESVGSEGSLVPVVSPEYVPSATSYDPDAPAYIPPSQPEESIEIETKEVSEDGEPAAEEESNILTTIVKEKQDSPAEESNIKKIN